MKVSTILDQVDMGSIALPEFQRGYVWNREQVRGLMDSLYRRHPVGSLLVWETRTDSVIPRGGSTAPSGTVRLLLDGQQRITSLYGIIRGKPPTFFQGNVQAFTGLYFHLDDERFEFYAPIRMRGNPLCINVTDLMRMGLNGFIQDLNARAELLPRLGKLITRLNAVASIKETELHMEMVTGEDKTVDVVVDIFNMVNSGGTKLSKGDLALAKVCAAWPEARHEMQSRLEGWRAADFHFKLEWLLRCVTTTVTNQAMFAVLATVDTPAFRDGLLQAEKLINYLLNLISGRLGLDHDRVLGSRYSFPLLVRYLGQRGGDLPDQTERDKLLYWYIHTFLWGRYAGSTETVLNQDLAALSDSRGLDRLMDQLRQNRGDLTIRADDFGGSSKGARFYPLLYMLTRVHHARDWDTGIELSNHMLGKLNTLQVHHIFPKSLLYDHHLGRGEVNAIANFTFLTQATNLKVYNRDPAEYLPEYAAKHPGALESHWIPMDRNLWKVERYAVFLQARRELLAKAANQFLGSLLAGGMPHVSVTGSVLDRGAEAMAELAREDENQALREVNAWVVEQGLPEGELDFELTGGNGEPLTVVDLAWPDGLQEGLSQPAALLIEAGHEVEKAVNDAGYRFFTQPEDLKEYIRREILALSTVK